MAAVPGSAGRGVTSPSGLGRCVSGISSPFRTLDVRRSRWCFIIIIYAPVPRRPVRVGSPGSRLSNHGARSLFPNWRAGLMVVHVTTCGENCGEMRARTRRNCQTYLISTNSGNLLCREVLLYLLCRCTMSQSRPPPPPLRYVLVI